MGDIQTVNETLEKLLAAETEQDVYDAVVDGVRRFNPEAFVVVSTLLPDGDSVRAVASAGLDGRMARIARVLGADPMAIDYRLSDMPLDINSIYLTGRLERLPRGLYDLMLGKVPKAACAAVERLLGIDGACVAGFAWGDLNCGALAIALPGRKQIAGAQAIETMVHQATIAIRRFRAQAELLKTAVQFNIFFRRGMVDFTVGVLAPVTGDPTLIRQIRVNLISNAIKFTADAPDPAIALDSRREDGEMVYSVNDNGAGFDMQHAGKLFQVFERLHGGEYEGSGIGLAIVRRAVEAHGGRVWAEGTEGKGATFSFSLPASGPPLEHIEQ